MGTGDISNMRIGSQKTLGKDKFGTSIFLYRNVEEGFDLQTDGRVYLSPLLARQLAAKLLEFAEQQTK